MKEKLLAVALVATLGPAGPAAAESGDFLCSANQSTADTCVIVGTWPIPDQTVLRFILPNVRVRGKLQLAVAGHCALDPTASCTSDAGCEPSPSPCTRAGAFSVEVQGLLTVENRAEVSAVGQAVSGDVVGPDGGTITFTSHDLTVAGTVSVASQGITGVPAGHAGTILANVDGAVLLPSTGRIDASTLRGGCGGSITIGSGPATPTTIDGSGAVTADGATGGGSLRLAARDRITLAATLYASNTNGDQSGRPPCQETQGGGTIRLDASEITFAGSAKAAGTQAAGGSVRLQGERAVTLDSSVGFAAVNVSGGDADAFTSGGTIAFAASAGDVALVHGNVEADGLSLGFGSDAGTFSITADSALRCEESGAPCATAAECAPAEACAQAGGHVLVQVPLSAVGGAGAGSGCAACEIRGARSVTVNGPVDVGGGRLRGVGGNVFMTAGGDLTVGPAPISGDAADGGTIQLAAGETPDVGGALRVITGTRVQAVAFQDDGYGGEIQMKGCNVTVEPAVVANVDGGSRGLGGLIDVVAHETLGIGPLSAFSAMPTGQIELSYRREVLVAPDSVFAPAPIEVQDPTLSPCPGCGNGVTESPEGCDGPGTCEVLGQVCVPPGVPNQCTCTADTCGDVPGVQPPEQCDGLDLAGASCEQLGFVGGALACTAECTFDTNGCVAAVCGDGVIGAGEACDVGGIDGAPPSFGGETCELLGFPDGGVLTCAPDCSVVIPVPHCATTVEQACTADAACPAAESCVGGCIACGNGFLDPDEECDSGTENRNAPNHCRADCRLPVCGDDTPDFSHCAADPDRPCEGPSDCSGGEACVPGEQCDQGTVFCLGGAHDGAPCCAEADCPGGDCPGDDCSGNRDDVPGCCHCDCSFPVVSCDALDCDDHDPCTADACDPVAGCQHAPARDGTSCADTNPCNGEETCRGGVCIPGTALACEDGNACTIDRCSATDGCLYEPVRLDMARGSVEESLHLEVCLGERIPRAILRPLRRAAKLMDLAAAAGDGTRSKRLVARAAHRLATASARVLHLTRRGVSGECAAALGNVIGSALVHAECLL